MRQLCIRKHGALWPCDVGHLFWLYRSSIIQEVFLIFVRRRVFKNLLNTLLEANVMKAWVWISVTYLLTPWCRVLLEKLTGLQLVKKFPAFHRTRRFSTALTSVRHLSLSWTSPIQSIYPHRTSCRSILILSTHLCLGLPSGLLLSGFPTKTLYTFTHTRHMPSPSHSSRFYHPHNIGCACFFFFYFSAVLLSWLWFFHPWRSSKSQKRRNNKNSWRYVLSWCLLNHGLGLLQQNKKWFDWHFFNYLCHFLYT